VVNFGPGPLYPQERTPVPMERRPDGPQSRSGRFIIIIISFMQGIYTYIPETNYVLREYSVATILLLLFMVLISLGPVYYYYYYYKFILAY